MDKVLIRGIIFELDEKKRLGTMRVDWYDRKLSNQWNLTRLLLKQKTGSKIDLKKLQQELNYIQFNLLSSFERVQEYCNGTGCDNKQIFIICGMSNKVLYYTLNSDKDISLYSGTDKSASKLVVQSTYALTDRDTLKLKNHNDKEGVYKGTVKKLQTHEGSKASNTTKSNNNTITKEQAITIVKELINSDDTLQVVDENYQKNNKSCIIIKALPINGNSTLNLNFEVEKNTGSTYEIYLDLSIKPYEAE